MKIVDCRENGSDLVKFETLPHFTVFEIPGEEGVFIKYDIPGVDVTVRAGCAGLGLNAFRVNDGDDMGGRLFWKLLPEKLVRPLDVELHIKGVKKYD
jgi:hypothetical protein